MDDRRELGVEDGFSAEGLSVRWHHGLAVASLRYFDAGGLFAGQMGEVLGGPLPAPLRAHRRVPELVLAWRSPTETLLVTGDAGWLAAAGAVAAARSDGCLVDQTGGILALGVTGAAAPDLMLRLGSSDSIPALGEARTGRLAELSVMSVCTRPGEILLLVERVYARHLIGWIRATVADF